MNSTMRRMLRRGIGCLVMFLLLAPSGHLFNSAAAVTPPCPAGSTPMERAALAAFTMPSDVPEGAEIVLARLTLSPG